MLPMQNKEKVRSNMKSVQDEVSESSSKLDVLKNVPSRICSEYEKIVEDGPTSNKRIIYKSKNPASTTNLKQTCSSVSRFTTEYTEAYDMNEDRLESGYHNPCVIDIMAQFDCRGKNILPVCVPENIIKPNVIQIHLSDSYTNLRQARYFKCFMAEKKRPRKMTRGTQTLYRESSMQTLPYLPDVSNDKETLKALELYKLPSILKGDGPPGILEVEMLERARKRWALEKALNEKFQCAMKAAREDIGRRKKNPRQKAILEAFEWEAWLEREEHIQGCQMMRFQLVLHIFEKRQREMHNVSDVRIQKRCEEIVQKRDHSLKKNDVEFGRELRRLKIKHEKRPRNWRKEKISDQLGDPSSEYYAPQMRYGVNPNRRHFQLSRKAFEMRMEDLEKRSVNMKNLECPFAKLKEWSKPKEQKAEVEQNFCTETNLQKLYEGLKGLREQSRRQKIVPKCLIEKTGKQFTEDVSISEDHLVEELNIAQDDNASVQTYEEEVQAGSSYSKDSVLEMYSQRNSQVFTVAEMLDERRREELENMLAEYEGTGIGWLMRFLSEERCRLQEQRKLHFVTMLAQKERWRREAAEAGLRQKENEMRKIYEQIFDETEKANREVCEQYLDKIFGIDTQEQADFDAISSITDLAKIIDTDLQRWLSSFSQIQNPLNYDDLRCLLRDLVFPDSIAECLSQKYETQSIVDYIINDVLLAQVYELLEPIIVVQSITNEFVDRLIDTDLYIFSSECSSECDCHGECICQPPELETKAMLRKLVRYAVPGRRWRTATERVADENVNDIIDSICGTAEKKRCTFSPRRKQFQRVVKEAPSVLDLSRPSNVVEYEKTNTSLESSSHSTYIDTITVISYMKPQRPDSKKASLVGNEKLLWDDTSRSSSQLQTVNDLSTAAASRDEFQREPLLLKEAISTFDVTGEMVSSKPKVASVSTDEDLEEEDQFWNRLSLSNKMEYITQSFLANIIDQVVKSIETSPSEDVAEPKEEKKLLGAKSQMSVIRKIISDFVESEESEESKVETETETESESEKITEEKIFSQFETFTERCEEEIFSKASDYEMVMYEGELKKILYDDEDECKCQMEKDYKETIRQLYECGKIKVIYKQKNESEQTEKDIDTAELTFEYATSFEEHANVVNTEEGGEHLSQISVKEEAVAERAADVDESKEAEATPEDIQKDNDVTEETAAIETEKTADEVKDITAAVVEEEPTETKPEEIEAATVVPQNTEDVTVVVEEAVVDDSKPEEVQTTTDVPEIPVAVEEVTVETSAAPATETEEKTVVDGVETVAPEESTPEEPPHEDAEQTAEPPAES